MRLRMFCKQRWCGHADLHSQVAPMEEIKVTKTKASLLDEDEDDERMWVITRATPIDEDEDEDEEPQVRNGAVLVDYVRVHTRQGYAYEDHAVREHPKQDAFPTRTDGPRDCRGERRIDGPLQPPNPGTLNVQILEWFEYAKMNDKDEVYTLLDSSVTEDAGFEVVTVDVTTRRIFSGIDSTDDLGILDKVGYDLDLSSFDSSDTNDEHCDDKSKSTGFKSTNALAPKAPSWDGPVKKIDLNTYFSIMSLVDGKGTFDETDVATQCMPSVTNSLEEKSTGTSATVVTETTDGSDRTCGAVYTKGRRPGSTTSSTANSKGSIKGKDKVVSMMFEQFQQFVRKGACFCPRSLPCDKDYQQTLQRSFSIHHDEDSQSLNSSTGESVKFVTLNSVVFKKQMLV